MKRLMENSSVANINSFQLEDYNIYSIPYRAPGFDVEQLISNKNTPRRSSQFGSFCLINSFIPSSFDIFFLSWIKSNRKNHLA